MGGSRGTAKSLKECEVIMVLPFIIKKALLRIAVLRYFWIPVCYTKINVLIVSDYSFDRKGYYDGEDITFYDKKNGFASLFKGIKHYER